MSQKRLHVIQGEEKEIKILDFTRFSLPNNLAIYLNQVVGNIFLGLSPTRWIVEVEKLYGIWAKNYYKK